MTGIQWTNETWNPTTGCDMVSPGCDHCYALKMAKRLKGMGSAKYQTDGDPRTSGPGFGIAEHADALDLPFKWRKPRKVFVNSMSDLFHVGVRDDFIHDVFTVMAQTPQHTYQILTKRHGRMRSLLNKPWFRDVLAVRAPEALWPLPNVHVGVSVEDQKRADLRIPALLDTPAAVRFLSCEPLVGQVDLQEWLYHAPSAYTEYGTLCSCGAAVIDAEDNCSGPKLDWVIVGGESGLGARPMDLDWAQMIVDYCKETRVAVFVKQLGSVHGPGKGGDLELWPIGLQVREFPTAVAS